LDSIGGLSFTANPDSIDHFEIINLENGSVIAMENLSTNEVQLLDGDYLLVGIRKNNIVYSEPLQSRPYKRASANADLSISQVNVYPRPASRSSLITIEGSYLDGQNVIISMSDMNGRELYREIVQVVNHSVNVQIPSPSVSGVFKVSLQQGSKTFSNLVPVNN